VASPIDLMHKLQLRSVLDDIHIDAIKIGMLHDAAVVSSVVECLTVWSSLVAQGTRNLPSIIVDPVIVSTTGHTLLEADAVDVLCYNLIPHAALVTPNIPEAQELLKRVHSGGKDILTLEDMVAAAEALGNLGCKAILLKGGHLTFTIGDVLSMKKSQENNFSLYWAFSCDPDSPAILHNIMSQSQSWGALQVTVDVLYVAFDNTTSASTTLYIQPRISTQNTHGTGCTLSSAVACGTAKGLPCEFCDPIASMF
jgi:hydroxymethylpyrimidine/phosphomethylpyrimidine kinase / thiaminase